MRIALGIEYEGSAFCGWQTQSGGCGAQDHLEAALARIAGMRIETICGGRTDAGVHALGQVVHFDAAVEQTGVAPLLRRLEQLGINYRDLNPRESSLEEIFVSLVSRRAHP